MLLSFAENIQSDQLGPLISRSDEGFCMAAQCSDKSIKLSTEKCNHTYAVFCGKLVFLISYHVYINCQNQMTCLSIKR